MLRALTALLLLLALVPPTHAAAVASPVDWVAAKFVLPYDADEFRVALSVVGAAPPGDMVVLRGQSFNGFAASLDPISYAGAQGGASAESVAVAAGVARAELKMGEDQDGRFGVGNAWMCACGFKAGAHVVLVIGIPGGSVEQTWADLEYPNGTSVPAVEVVSGSGSGLVRASDAGLGAALTLPDSPAGARGTVAATRIARTLPAPSVGGLAWDCSASWGCESTWTAPDGTTGTWRQQTTSAGGQPYFTGEGDFTFTFRGETPHDLVGGYVPVGAGILADW